MRRRTVIAPIGLATALVLIAGVLVLRSFVFIPFIGDDMSVIHDDTTLPDRLHVCGRTWEKDALNREHSEEDLVALYGTEPVLVNPTQFAACPDGACTSAGAGPCATVIFARVGRNAFVDYSLIGGP